MKNSFFLLLLLLLFYSCTNEPKEEVNNAIEEIQVGDPLSDSLLAHCLDEIQKEYRLHGDPYIKLQLTGSVSFEDENFLILSFEEILEYGSWHYSNSSLFFLKSGNSLTPLVPTVHNGLNLTADNWEDVLSFPNRIPGIYVENEDFNGDGIPEFVFQAYGAIRTGFIEIYGIYQVDSKNLVLNSTNLVVTSTGFQGVCETNYGQLKTFKIIERTSLWPLIEVEESISVCDNNAGKVKLESSQIIYYVWDESSSDFKEFDIKGEAIKSVTRMNIFNQLEKDALLKLLELRFKNNMHRHENVDWKDVKAKLEASPSKLYSLSKMESSGGEPDLVSITELDREYLFVDCSKESPIGRRSLCYDLAALESRKDFKPENSAVELAATMGIEILNEDQYRRLQKIETFDTKTSSWLQTPTNIRKLGGAIFGDFRYGNVFIYHNGASSYYAARAFRGILKV